MSVREIRAAGPRAQELATSLLQRARRADPTAGLWEAADVQWWWRSPRRSDDVEKLFWLDDDGPVAGVLLTTWAGETWQCDPIAVPHASGLEPGDLWERALEHAGKHCGIGFEVPVSDDDPVFRGLAERSGLAPGDRDNTAWMVASDGPEVAPPAAGFALVDRTQRSDAPHPMSHRSGEGIARRLEQCSLYDHTLDLAVEAADGRTAGYALFWLDPVTKVGLVEPVRVEDGYQRRGLARAMLSAGIDRLAARGAERVKVSYETQSAGALYHGVGFRQTSTATWYRTARE
ncbi:GNAT family N-acetyltransferase [Occultella gossypii]|uniref:GNAT family N-acetyltransferase n=1 Tax=Occultella gossypii TaxID=2800820 RepID=A0ABS7S7D8_9MICO|nr:GNAT family N-acetyltransferase [Occultella gossypii]MBZ2195098.1 GNAT family N-acetyltransferase [Occultella gossypii]